MREHMIDQWMNEGIKAARAGQRKEAARWFYRVVKQDPKNQVAWLYFCDVQEDINKQREILVWLANLFPENQGVQRRLQRLDGANLTTMQRPTPVSQNQWNAAPIPPPGNANQPGVIPAQNPPHKNKIGAPAIVAITALVSISCIAIIVVTYLFWNQRSTTPISSPAKAGLPGWFENMAPKECRISFVSKRDGFPNIYGMDEYGKNVQQYTHDQDNRYYLLWSPDNSKILFVDERDKTVFIRDADGRNEQELFDLENHDVFDIKWSPDSEKIAYIIANKHDTYLNIIDISEYDHHQVNKKVVVDDDANIFWSPDSSKIAFASEEQVSNLIIMNADGSLLHKFDVSAEMFSISWSPDTKQLFFQSFDDNLYIAEESNNTIRKIGELNFFMTQSVWAPDGEHILFSGNEGTFVIKPDGSDFRQLSPESNEFWENNFPGYPWHPWSPNSNQIALSLENGFHTVSVSGESKDLLSSNLPTSFQWGSKGEHLLMSVGNDIYVVDASGNNLRQLTFDGLSYMPSWSPGCK